MRTKLLSLFLGLGLVVGLVSQSVAAEKIIVYTSMKESLIGQLKNGFTKKHPEIAMDYQSAGAGKLMAKIAAERESGKILADVLWTSEVPDFYSMKKDGLLEIYISKEFKQLINPFPDFDGSFTAARLGTLGIAYNTTLIKTSPAFWQDLLKPEFKNGFGIADPALSGTSYMSLALLVNKFGWDFISQLAANGARIGKGSGQVVDDTASGELSASLAVDYITTDKIAKGAPLALAYPPEMLVVPSPVAIIKNTPNLSAAQKFVDYLLSQEAQTLIAGEGTLPVRDDVVVPAKFNLPAPRDAMKRSIPVNYIEMMEQKEATVKKFKGIMQGKN